MKPKWEPQQVKTKQAQQQHQETEMQKKIELN